MDASPLPQPSAWIYGELAPGKALTFARPQMARTAGPDGVTPIYTAADLRAYGESCARMAREEERERCIQACKGEEVDADGSQHREDVAYNTAIEHCIEAIRKG